MLNTEVSNTSRFQKSNIEAVFLFYKYAKYLTKTFGFDDFWNKFCGKIFRKFKIREMLAAPKKKKKHQVLL